MDRTDGDRTVRPQATGRRSPHRLGNRMNEPMGQAPAPPVPATRFVNEAPTGACRALAAHAQSRRAPSMNALTRERMPVRTYLRLKVSNRTCLSVLKFD